MGYRFDIQILNEAKAFIESLDEKTQLKVIYVMRKVREMQSNDPELFKKISENIWEFRIRYRMKQIRIFSFWDTENNTLVVATHGIIKKSQKTPPKEIKKAEDIRTRYFEAK